MLVQALLFRESGHMRDGCLLKIATESLSEYNVPGICLASSATAIMRYATKSFSGTGVVVELSASRSLIVPVYKGHAVQHAIQQFDVTGDTLSDFLHYLLSATGDLYGERKEMEEQVAEHKLSCHVALNYDGELNGLMSEVEDWNATPSTWQIECPEALFQPNLMPQFKKSRSRLGLHCFVEQAIQACDPDIRADLAHNVVMGGGGSGWQGLKERMRKELQELMPRLAVEVSIEDSFAAWKGAAMLANDCPFWPYCCMEEADWENPDCDGPRFVDKVFF